MSLGAQSLRVGRYAKGSGIGKLEGGQRQQGARGAVLKGRAMFAQLGAARVDPWRLEAPARELGLLMPRAPARLGAPVRRGAYHGCGCLKRQTLGACELQQVVEVGAAEKQGRAKDDGCAATALRQRAPGATAAGRGQGVGDAGGQGRDAAPEAARALSEGGSALGAGAQRRAGSPRWEFSPRATATAPCRRGIPILPPPAPLPGLAAAAAAPPWPRWGRRPRCCACRWRRCCCLRRRCLCRRRAAHRCCRHSGHRPRVRCRWQEGLPHTRLRACRPGGALSGPLGWQLCAGGAP
jgi:hypothetical protein